MLRNLIATITLTLCTPVSFGLAASPDDERIYSLALAIADEVVAAVSIQEDPRSEEDARIAASLEARARSALDRELNQLICDVSDEDPQSAATNHASCDDSVKGGTLCVCSGKLGCAVLKGLCAYGGHTYQGGSESGTCSF
jgi:hypothetical protein